MPEMQFAKKLLKEAAQYSGIAWRDIEAMMVGQGLSKDVLLFMVLMGRGGKTNVIMDMQKGVREMCKLLKRMPHIDFEFIRDLIAQASQGPDVNDNLLTICKLETERRLGGIEEWDIRFRGNKVEVWMKKDEG